MNSHVIFKDDEKESSPPQSKTIPKDPVPNSAGYVPNTLPNFSSSLPASLPPHSYNENIPFIGSNEDFLSQIVTAANSRATGVEHFPHYPVFAPSSHLASHSDVFLHPENPSIVTMPPTASLNIIPNYTTPGAAIGLNCPTMPNSMYSLGLPVESNSAQVIRPQYVARSPVYERISPVGLRHMPYSRMPKMEKYNIRHRSLKTPVSDALPSAEVLPSDLTFKLPDYLLNGRPTGLVGSDEVQYASHGPKIWDYIQQTPVKSRLSFERASLNTKQPHILPSPEISPDTTPTFIGQHSQGIGGHYADTYFAKKIF